MVLLLTFLTVVFCFFFFGSIPLQCKKNKCYLKAIKSSKPQQNLMIHTKTSVSRTINLIYGCDPHSSPHSAVAFLKKIIMSSDEIKTASEQRAKLSLSTVEWSITHTGAALILFGWTWGTISSTKTHCQFWETARERQRWSQFYSFFFFFKLMTKLNNPENLRKTPICWYFCPNPKSHKLIPYWAQMRRGWKQSVNNYIMTNICVVVSLCVCVRACMWGQ